VVISQRPAGGDLALRITAWTAFVVTYLTLWSAGLGWMDYWWAWLFVLVPICFNWLTWHRPGSRQRPADGFVPPRVRFPAPHRRHRRQAR
jgi:hypothetical protein